MLLLSTLSLASCKAFAQPPSQPHSRVLWAAPPNVDNGTPMRELFEHPEAWQQARGRMAGLGYASIGLAQFSDDDLRVWFPQLRRWNLKLSLEVGAIKGVGTHRHDCL